MRLWKENSRRLFKPLAVVLLFGLQPAVLLQAQDELESTLVRSPRPTRSASVFSSKAAVSVVSDQQMDFGQLADKNGAAVLGLNNAITADPDLIVYGGSPYSAICTISGDPNTAVDVAISSLASNGLSLSTFVSSSGPLPLVGVVLNGSGELELTFGATITVDSGDAFVGAGQTISYTITAIYN